MGRLGFEALYETEFANVFRTAYLMTGDREEALDLTHEAFARAFEHWSAVGRASNPAAWLQRVVANLAISWQRRRRVRERFVRRFQPDVAMPEAEPTDPELIDALQALTPSQRVVIVLRYFGDRSIEDVAQTLGKRPGTVTALTSQALGKLRDQLRGRSRDEARR
jgi:RNA polymerase sigma-70 factor, ECF subfamily